MDTKSIKTKQNDEWEITPAVVYCSVSPEHMKVKCGFEDFGGLPVFYTVYSSFWDFIQTPQTKFMRVPPVSLDSSSKNTFGLNAESLWNIFLSGFYRKASQEDIYVICLGEMRNLYPSLTGKPEGKRLLTR